MESYLIYVGIDVFSFVLVYYDVCDVPPTHVDSKKVSGNNAKSKNAILFGLIESELIKLMHCKSIKDVWENLNQNHEGCDKVNQAQIHMFRMRFESLIMNEDESIT